MWKNSLFDFLRKISTSFVERYANRLIPRWLIFFLDLSIVSVVYLLICMVRSNSIIPSFAVNSIGEYIVLLMMYVIICKCQITSVYIKVTLNKFEDERGIVSVIV